MELGVDMKAREEKHGSKNTEITPGMKDIIFQLIFMCGGIGAMNLRRLGFSLAHGPPLSCHSPVLLRNFAMLGMTIVSWQCRCSKGTFDRTLPL
jgi:hypothetical protein